MRGPGLDDGAAGAAARNQNTFAVKVVTLVALVGTVGLAGCENRTASADGGKGPATAAVSATTTQAVRHFGVTDFVANPRIDPAEQAAGRQRFVSMAPSVTELSYALGLGDQLVGRTQYCQYPPAAARIPVVGALLDPNLERILGLRPDRVLIAASSTNMLREKFETLKLPLAILPDSSLEDIYRAVEQLGRLGGRPRTAAALVEGLRSDLARLKDLASKRAGQRPASVVFVTGALSNPPSGVWVAGPDSYVETLVTMAGAKNLAGKIANRPWFEATAEQIVWLAPDVIIEVREPGQMAQRDDAAAAWRRLPGLERTRIVTLDDPAMLIPGPRVNVMLAQILEGLYGADGDRQADGIAASRHAD